MNLETIKRLLAVDTSPWISIYMPTHRHAPETAQDPIRYRGLVEQARALLAEHVDEKARTQLIDTLGALDAPEFWNHQRDGLAVFCARGHESFVRLSTPVAELVVVGPSPHTKPLVREATNSRRYFALALSTTELALYACTPTSVDPVDLGSMPTSLASALGVRSHGHVDFRGVAKGWRPVYRAAGPGQEAKKEALHEYFRRVDRALASVLDDEHAPLVLAGVGYLQDIYRSVSKNPRLLDAGADGNFDKAATSEVLAATWPLVEATLREEHDHVIEQYGAAAAQGRGSDELQTIGHAVAHGRVRTLLVSGDDHLFGVVDRESGAIALHEEQRGAHDVEVLDELAEMTLLRGGEVLVLDRDRMPTKTGCAALFRW